MQKYQSTSKIATRITMAGLSSIDLKRWRQFSVSLAQRLFPHPEYSNLPLLHVYYTCVHGSLLAITVSMAMKRAADAHLLFNIL